MRSIRQRGEFFKEKIRRIEAGIEEKEEAVVIYGKCVGARTRKGCREASFQVGEIKERQKESGDKGEVWAKQASQKRPGKSIHREEVRLRE